jgi:hypothetical protein
VTHPFVTDMGDGAMPVAKFRDYFIQDFVFVKDLVKMVAENFEVARICLGDRSESLSGKHAGPGGRPVRDGVHINGRLRRAVHLRFGVTDDPGRR